MRIVSDLGTNEEVQLSTTPLTVASVEGGNRSAVDLYLQLHATDEAVADMTTCLYTLPVPARTRTVRRLSGDGVRFAPGLRVLWSTTEHADTPYGGDAAELGVWVETPNPEAP